MVDFGAIRQKVNADKAKEAAETGDVELPDEALAVFGKGERVLSYKSSEEIEEAFNLPDNALEIYQSGPLANGERFNLGQLEPRSVILPPQDIEISAPETVVRMFETTVLGQLFSFKTILNGGAAHVQAMRVCLSRHRQEIKQKGIRVLEFKLYLVSIEPKPNYDFVTIVRATHTPPKPNSLHSRLLQYIEAESRAMEKDE